MKCLCSIDGNGGSAGSANGAMSIERAGAMSTGVGLPTPSANISGALSVACAPGIMNFSRIPTDEVVSRRSGLAAIRRIDGGFLKSIRAGLLSALAARLTSIRSISRGNQIPRARFVSEQKGLASPVSKSMLSLSNSPLRRDEKERERVKPFSSVSLSLSLAVCCPDFPPRPKTQAGGLIFIEVARQR